MQSERENAKHNKHLYQLLWSLYIVVRYIVEESIQNFKFWSGGKDHADMLTCDELETFGDYITESFCEDPTDTDINDLMWHDFDHVWESVLGHSIIDGHYIREDDVINADDTPINASMCKDLIIERLELDEEETDILRTLFYKFYHYDRSVNTVNGIFSDIEDAMHEDGTEEATQQEIDLLDSITAYIEDHNDLLYFNDCIAD